MVKEKVLIKTQSHHFRHMVFIKPICCRIISTRHKHEAVPLMDGNSCGKELRTFAAPSFGLFGFPAEADAASFLRGFFYHLFVVSLHPRAGRI